MIFNKNKLFFQKKLSEYIGKPKDLWKALKSLGLSNKISSCEVSALQINNTVEHDANSVLEDLKIITQLQQRTLQTCSPKHSINSLLTLSLNIIKI